MATKNHEHSQILPTAVCYIALFCKSATFVSCHFLKSEQQQTFAWKSRALMRPSAVPRERPDASPRCARLGTAGTRLPARALTHSSRAANGHPEAGGKRSQSEAARAASQPMGEASSLLRAAAILPPLAAILGIRSSGAVLWSWTARVPFVQVSWPWSMRWHVPEMWCGTSHWVPWCALAPGFKAKQCKAKQKEKCLQLPQQRVAGTRSCVKASPYSSS